MNEGKDYKPSKAFKYVGYLDVRSQADKNRNITLRRSGVEDKAAVNVDKEISDGSPEEKQRILTGIEQSITGVKNILTGSRYSLFNKLEKKFKEANEVSDQELVILLEKQKEVYLRDLALINRSVNKYFALIEEVAAEEMPRNHYYDVIKKFLRVVDKIYYYLGQLDLDQFGEYRQIFKQEFPSIRQILDLPSQEDFRPE